MLLAHLLSRLELSQGVRIFTLNDLDEEPEAVSLFNQNALYKVCVQSLRIAELPSFKHSLGLLFLALDPLQELGPDLVRLFELVLPGGSVVVHSARVEVVERAAQLLGESACSRVSGLRSVVQRNWDGLGAELSTVETPGATLHAFKLC